MYLIPLALRSTTIMDVEKLHEDIRSALSSNSFSANIISAESNKSADDSWSVSEDGLLRNHGKIYVPDTNDLRLKVLQHKHDHILSGHFGLNKTIDMIC